jgi:signal transduction protein with GAF and PtsI domain
MRYKKTSRQEILSALNNASNLLTSKIGLEKPINHILEIILAQTEADRASVLIVDDKTQKLAVKASAGLRPESIDVEKRVEKKIGSSVAKRAKPLILHKAEFSPFLKKGSIGAEREIKEEIALTLPR